MRTAQELQFAKRSHGGQRRLFTMKRVNAIFCYVVIVAVCSLFGAGELFAAAYKLGVVLPLSGEFGKIGQNLLHAVELSVKNIAKDKTIDFKLVVKDDKNDPLEAEKVARELVADPELIGVIGHYYSTTALGAAKVYNDAKIPVLCVYASDQSVGKSSPYLFSMNISNQKQGEMIAVHLKQVFKKKNILLINNNNHFGLSLRDSFQAKASRLGINIVKHLEYDHAKKLSDDFIASALPDKSVNQKFDAVVVFSHSSSGVKLVKQLREHGIQAMIMGPNTFNSQGFLDENLISDEQTKNVFVTAPFLWEMGNERALAFRRDFEKKYKEEPNITAPACSDAVLMFVSAIEHAHVHREKIRSYFASLTWKTAVSGITGDLFFNKKDRMMDQDVFVTEIKDGRFKVHFHQLTKPHEPYVFKQKAQRLAQGYLVELDNQIYHKVDVVFVGLDFVRVNDVNMQKMTFDTEFHLWFKWMNDKINLNDIDIYNGISGSRVLLKEDLASPVKYRASHYKGSYINPFDLKNFPFDTQTLPITIGNRARNSTHLILVVDSKHMTHQPVKEIYPQEWRYVGKEFNAGLHRFDSTFGDSDYRMGKDYKSKIFFSTATVSITLKRIIFPYLFNVFLPLFVILLIMVFIFRIPVEQFALRFNLSMTSLLSVLVYHMTQKSALPRVGYLMALDYYFIVAYIFILTLIAFNVYVMIQVLDNKVEIVQRINKIFMRLFFPASILVFTLLSMFFTNKIPIPN
jgi:ABC-type branched-subunit amino acid transport system substrate-binding protein